MDLKKKAEFKILYLFLTKTLRNLGRKLPHLIKSSGKPIASLILSAKENIFLPKFKNKSRCSLSPLPFNICSQLYSSQRRQWHPPQCPCLENPVDGGAW